MSDNPLILVEDVSKAFVLYKKPSDLLYEVFKKDFKADSFWALKNISFSLQEGDRVGIVGSNGAGKSTLLSIITGFLSPTSGKIKIHGKLTSMLSLTTFLDERKTGIQNILFNFEVLQIDKRKSTELLEEIIDFTELENFIYAPVHTYSSGMRARLAFAISTAIVPDILVIDEVLSVGDSYFVGKATQRMKNLCDKGRGLLYVSHSVGAVEMLCNKALWLDHGALRMFGPTKDVVTAYEEDSKKRQDITSRAASIKTHAEKLTRVQEKEFNDPNYWRFRIVPTKGTKFSDKHYIHKIIATVGKKRMEVSLKKEDGDTLRNKLTKVDFFNSQWGASYKRNEEETREITNSSSSFLTGAQFSIRKPSTSPQDIFDLTIEIIYCSEHNIEDIKLEYLDEENARWSSAAPLANAPEITTSSHEWKTGAFKMRLKIPDAAHYNEVKEKLEKLDAPSVKIQKVYLTVNNTITDSVTESQPFKIVVLVEVTRATPMYDVGINIKRADGVYTFWYTTAVNKDPVPQHIGMVRAEFIFDPNLFAAGEYGIDCFTTNGFDIENNFPQSEVFDRHMNCRSFSVKRKFPLLFVGLINQPIETKLLPLSDEQDSLAS